MANIYVDQVKQSMLEMDNFSNELIDPALIQQLQDNFCRANDLYIVCMGRKQGVITNAYGTKEELSFIHSVVDNADYLKMVRLLNVDTVESMVEHNVGKDYIKMCGVSTRLEGQSQIIWVVVGFLSEKLTEEVQLPDFIRTTTEDRFYRSVEFLETLSRQLFVTKLDEYIAQEAMQKSVMSEAAIERELHRSESMTAVVRNLESDDAFEKLIHEVLRETCESIGTSGGCLIRKNQDNETVDMICEYVQDSNYAMMAKFSQISLGEVPFFDGKPYMVSTSSMKPRSFIEFFNQWHFSAAIFQPIVVNDKLLMYLCFYENEATREWETPDVNFVNDVRHVVTSILAKRIAKNSLASSYASLEAILENAGCGIYVADYEKRTLLYTNQKFKELFRRSIERGVLENMIFSTQEMARKNYYEEQYSAEEEKWLDVYKTQIKWVDGRTVNLCTLYDITEKKLYQKKVENQANNDFLTGLFNRMRCEQDLEKYVEKAKEVKGTGALLYIDLDDFKHINDGLGHQYGDVLLKAISKSLSRVSGVEKCCYRMGGDEFIVIVPDYLYRELERIVTDITSIFGRPWFLKGEDYYCTMSMGIACFPGDGETVEELIRKADMALLTAKRTGKNRVEYFDDSDELSSNHRLDLEKNMRTAAMNSCSEFEVYYQPIIDMSDGKGKCCGAEALVRWNSAAMGFVRPDDFIPLAEYLGLINPIGDHVLMQAAKRCKYWNDMGHPDFKINVNLSVVQLLQNDIVKKIKKVLEDTHLNPHNLTLEVTESLAVNDMDRMKRILSEIKNLGIRVALDDFGTGYSSLNHIREMPLDVIKIDRCFVEHLGDDDFSDAFVKMVSELANSIGVYVCVEGVETEKQLEIVTGMNINMIQGYLFGKPMKIEEYEMLYL